MAKKPAGEIPFELGQWVTTEDGYGQVMYIRSFYIEDYETQRRERRNGAFIRYIFICKILCDFNGKIRKNKRINIYTSISKLDKDGAAYVKGIKLDQPGEYAKYIVHDDKVDICRQLFLDYQVVNKSSLNIEEVGAKLAEIELNLLPAFTFKEFVDECRKQNFPIDLKLLVPYGYSAKKEERITLRLDSYLYKVKGKEAIFHGVRMFA
ncbi:MAG TPA: hypothetical protein VGD65_06155 [Chryseosolibacter sp.]